MTKIYTIIDDSLFSRCTVHKDLEKLGLNFDGYYGWTMNQARNKEFFKDLSNDIVFFFESAVLKMCLLTTGDLRGFFPNAKLVAIGSDTIVYINGYRHIHGGPKCLTDEKNNAEFQSIYDVDLFLDLLDECTDNYTNKGINTHSWMWTISEYLIEELDRLDNIENKTRDFICIAAMYTTYRKNLVNYMHRARRDILVGGAHGSSVSYTPKWINEEFGKAIINLGTTSPSWTGVRTMKGFRDFVSPFCGTPLIYDSHPDVVRKYPCVPTYDYDNFDSILELFRELYSDKDKYYKTVDEQKTWARENTIYKQFKKLIDNKVI